MKADTPIRLEKEVYRQAKIQAAIEGVSLKTWLSRVVEKALSKKERKA